MGHCAVYPNGMLNYVFACFLGFFLVFAKEWPVGFDVLAQRSIFVQ